MPNTQPPIILASSSPYRRELLARLRVQFTHISPDIDESAIDGESPEELALRLATEKATIIAHRHTSPALVIGSDQVASLKGQVLTKPGNFERAVQQLEQCSAQAVTFFTGLVLINSGTGKIQYCVEPFTVHFRTLTRNEITTYLELEQPFDCAGSFKVEGLGISLFEKLAGNDPNSLIGLPLIQLINFLSKEGINILDN